MQSFILHHSIYNTVLISLQKIDPCGQPYLSFQLFGFDFLVDADLHVWLMEVNGAPACAR